MLSSSEAISFVSVVMTAWTGGEALPRYLARVSAELSRSFPYHELVVVDNATTEGAMDGVRAALVEIPNIHVIRLTRRMDNDIALTAGLDHCIGDVIVTVQVLRDPPSAIVRAVRSVAGGCDIVYGVDSSRSESRRLSHRLLTRGWHWFFRRTSGIEMPVVDFSLRAVSRRVLNTWLGNTDRDRLLRIMPALSGFDYTIMPYEGEATGLRPRRPIRRSVRTGSRTILSASAVPLRIAYLLALGAGILNLLYALYVIIIATARGGAVEGWVSLSLQSAGMFFLISVILAILAEYVFQIAQRTGERPLYRIRDEASSAAFSFKDRLNVESPAQQPPASDDPK